jgi:2-amino-4-hydroxy-6-hydroxymethyldihydropteridine diphosphokinase
MRQTRRSSPLVIDSMTFAIIDRMDDSSSISKVEGRNPVNGLVVVGVGGNQGQVLENFCTALDKIHPIAPIAALSCLYRSAAIGPEQADFLNGAFALSWARPLMELLPLLQTVETELGRVRRERWGPRTIDLDILWASNEKISTSNLTVPHPELERRAFALRPLLDLEPSAKDLRNGVPYASILASLNGQILEKVSLGNWWVAEVN